MTDIVDKATRSRMMAGIKSKSTTPEVFLRHALHAQGFRYRLGGAGLPGKPDLVFPSRRTVVFVNGCFWHRHLCASFKWPSDNEVFWKKKLDANAARDFRNSRALHALGWRVLTVWECSLRKTKYKMPNAVVNMTARALSKNPDSKHP